MMKTTKAPLWALLTVLLISVCLLPNTAVAKSQCREVTRGSTFEGLGEEFPELYIRLLVCVIGNGLPGFILDCTEALGEEFPEKHAPPQDEGLGEEFPEGTVRKADSREALGEEFPEK
jgi:hypothetical protein